MPRFTPLLLLCATLLAGCAAHLQHSAIDQLRKDSSAAEVDRVLGNAPMRRQVLFVHQGQQYQVREFFLQTGSNQIPMTVCTPVCHTIWSITPVTTEYLIIQTLPELRLHAWGTLEALSKDPDASISDMMPALKKTLSGSTR